MSEGPTPGSHRHNKPNNYVEYAVQNGNTMGSSRKIKPWRELSNNLV